eukprot:Skav223213  [mRNA]  locus=scaffold2231:23152:26304:- [translate_table: standard]
MKHVKALPFGPPLLDAIASDDWGILTAMTEALDYMKNRCVLCGFGSQSTLALNSHFKRFHVTALPHTFVKGTQLQHTLGGSGVCNLCKGDYKSRHMCPVSTQLAMLQLHFSLDGHGLIKHLRCEVCHTWFDDSKSLTAHLCAAHQLATNDWVQSRDALDFNQPVCNHCYEQFTNMSSLRAHILQGTCSHFDASLPKQIRSIPDDLVEAVRSGKLVRYLSEDCLQQMTKHCSFCNARYGRPQDLAQHLMQEHGDLLLRSHAYCAQLLDDLIPTTGCLCRPQVKKQDPMHVCLPVRQLACQIGRLCLTLFVPHDLPVTQAQMLLHLPEGRMSTLLQHLISTRDFIDMLHCQDIIEHLSGQCILCGFTAPAAHLHWHLLEAHNYLLPTVKHLLPQIIRCLKQTHVRTAICEYCDLAFHQDGMLTSKDEDLESHFRFQCPTILQFGLVLSLPQHGRARVSVRSHAVAGRAGIGDELPPIVAALSTHGSVSRREAPQEDKTRRPIHQHQRSRSIRGRVDTPTGVPGLASRQAPQWLANARQFCDVSGESAIWCSSSPPRTRTKMAGTENTESSGLQSEDVSGETPDERAAPTSPSGVEVQPRGRDDDHGHPERHVDPGRSLDICEVEPSGAKVDPGQQEAYPHGPHDSSVPGTCGVLPDAKLDHSLPCPEQPTLTTPMPLASPAQHATDRCLQPGGHATGIAGVGAPGHLSEDAHPDPESRRREAAGDARLEQRPWEGEELSSDEQAEDLSSFQHLCAMTANQPWLSLLCHQWANCGADCYLNAAIHAWLWTILHLDHGGALHSEQLQDISLFAMSPSRNLVVTDQSWLQPVLTCWPGKGQCDAAEFTVLLMGHFAPLTQCSPQWEKRSREVTGLVTKCDGNSDTTEPDLLLFKLASNIPVPAVSLQSLCDTWSQVDGTQTALIAESPVICIHIDRTVQLTDRADPSKLLFELFALEEVDIPIFASDAEDAMKVTKVKYKLISLLSHFGDGLHNGHYRAALREAGHWLLTDDAMTPRAVFDLPKTFATGVTVLWLLQADKDDRLRSDAIMSLLQQ